MLELRIAHRAINLVQDLAHPVTELPARIMRLELSHIADPPNVIADAIRLLVAPIQFLSADLLARLDGFQHRTIGMAAAANVVNLRDTRGPNELGKAFHQIETMNVVAHLFA